VPLPPKSTQPPELPSRGRYASGAPNPLAAYLRKSLDAEKYRLAPSLQPIKEVLAMLEPPREIPKRAPLL
jgi:hypothetical protein